MPKPLPENWKSLNVSKDLGLRGDYPQNLKIKQQTRSKSLYANWLPSEKDDPRPHQGRTKDGKGKRIAYCKSMETDDPWEAGKRSIAWFQHLQEEIRDRKEEQEGKYQNTLADYWDQWFPAESARRESDLGFKKWRRENMRIWQAEGYGISHQPWSKISVDLITRKDFQEHFDHLEKRARESKGTNGSGVKAEHKTLINKLLELAQDDFSGHSFPSFPSITKQYKQVIHLNQKQWETLIKQVISLSGGAARKQLTLKQYENLEFTYQRLNQKNWVDLYDALMLQWFFYFRAEDMQRLRNEWFRDQGDETVICRLEKTKGDREIHVTEHYRSDAYRFWKRLMKRRSTKGYLVAPHIKRPSQGGPERGVLDLLNYLLSHAIQECLPDFREEGRSWTTIRHTAFRLTLEEMPNLGIPPDINAFAANGHTSPQMLRETYLNYIEAGRTAKKARAKLKPTDYSLIKRVDLE